MIERRVWSEEVARVLRPSLDDDLPVIRDEVINGDAALYYIHEGPAKGFFVLRLEDMENGNRELVIVAAAGCGWRYSMRRILHLVGRTVDSVRIHTNREGIKRWARGFGFMPTDEGPEILRLNYGQ